MAFKILSFISILPIFQAGYIVKDEVKLNTTYYKQENILYLDVGVRFVINDFFYIQGDIENYFEPCENRIRFSPILDRYNVAIGVKFKENMYIELFTNCIHPVISSNDPNENYINVPQYYGSKTMIVLSINK